MDNKGVDSPDNRPYEHCGCFSRGDLDGPSLFVPPKSLHLSLKLILRVPILLDWTLCHPYLYPPAF